MSFWRAVDGAIFRTAVSEAEKVRASLADSLNVEEVAKSWFESHPAGGETTAKEAKEWARVHLRFNSKPVIEALRNLYATGWVLGQDISGQAIELAKIQQKAPQINFDWSKWKAGNKPAAALVNPVGGLQRLLDRAGIMSESLNATTVERVGVKLADALNSGKGLSELSQSLREVVGDPTRSITIAATELSRAQNVASFETYRESGIEQIEWLALDECDECAENVDASPIGLGEDFPSGDTEPPAHPNCRCTIAPVIDTGGAEIEADMPEKVDASEEAMDAAAAVFESARMVEPEFTNVMKGLAAENNAELSGLEHRLKTEESLARKITADAREVYQGDVSLAASKVSDSVRYTMVADANKYGQVVENSLAKLKEQGWGMRVKNSWKADSSYKGINVALTSPDGVNVELQFHTPQSLAVKETLNHDLYEKYRILPSDNPTALKLWDAMVKNAGLIPEPAEVAAVGRNFVEAKKELSVIDKVIASRYEIRDLINKYEYTDNPFLTNTNASLSALQKFLGVGGKPEIVESAAELKGKIIYRGVQDVENRGLADAFRFNEEAWQGRGIYGNGNYFSSELKTAESYANALQLRVNEEWNPQNLTVAGLKENAKIAKFSNQQDLESEARRLFQELSDKVANNLASELNVSINEVSDAAIKSELKIMGVMPERDFYMSSSASQVFLVNGYDAVEVNVFNSETTETYTIVLNRAALQVVRTGIEGD